LKRDKILGFDPREKIVFAFLYEKDQKALSLFARCSNESTQQAIQHCMALNALFWEQGAALMDIKQLFEEDFKLKELKVEHWTEISKK